MSTTPDFLNYVIEQVSKTGDIRSIRMMGEALVYVDDKPALLVCDNIVFVKKLPFLDGLLSETGFPYDGAKEHYILDIDDKELSQKIVRLLALYLPVPKKKKKSVS